MNNLTNWPSLPTCMFIMFSMSVVNPDHALDLGDTILVNQEEFQMEPEQILDMKERKLRHRTIKDVLVQ